MKRRTLWSLPILLTLTAVAAPAAADWLITRDGARIETKGPWKVEGRRVLFTLPNGTLSAMRSSEIDFEASDAATTEANAPPAAPEQAEAMEKEPLPEPVLVLTNKDIAPGEVPDPDAPAKPEVLPSIADREPVQVISWKRYELDDGSIELRGTVRNTSASVAANIRVQATVKDEEGQEIATGNAFLGNSSLVSGRSTTFRIVLPDVIDFYGDPEFEVSSTKVTIGGATRPSTEAQDKDSEQADPDDQADEGDLDEGEEEEGLGTGDDAKP